ncbi:uncharacterized protein LOC133785283 [Humulus lupulus]|uniref:uncharacterized protein LOC133785283 n=1 Tax=Humulus lupulus TaxID=3486 RepID=UPI002B40A847|nr:uncharacterized protein LOC133785283 [Humulus lupulus]
MTAQVSSMTNLLKNMSLGEMVQPTAMGQVANVSCIYCGDGHAFESCPSNPASVCYVGNQNANRNNPYSNSYNPGWRQHPNFSWGSQGASSSGAPMQNKTTYPPRFSQQQQRAQPPPPQVSQSSSLESVMKEYMAKNNDVIQSQATSLRNLETQLGQLANELRNRPQGTLPSVTENPRKDGKEHCKAVTLRSGKNVELTEDNCTRNSEPTSIQSSVDKGDKTVKSKILNDDPVAIAATIPPQNATGKPINILTKKRRLDEFETVALTEGCSAILKSKIPPKLKDLGSFTIPCSIGGRDVGRALCDLGASINLMPMSIFRKLGIGEARPTTVTLQLADRSMAHPEGKIEDVLVQVDKFIFPANFIILDYEADRDVPIILGRPFLATGRTLIDVQNGELALRVNDQQVTFNVFNAIKFPDVVEECSRLSVIESIVTEKFHKEACKDGVGVRRPFESLNLSEGNFKPPKPSILEPPKLELKPLPSHLKYAYLRDNDTLPVIISAMLGAKKESLLLAVLKKYTRAISWTMADIKGISPSFCMHKILLEDCCNNSVEQQRRLNPIMKEVVRKEIIKWLDYGIVYPISDSSWVSPI